MFAGYEFGAIVTDPKRFNHDDLFSYGLRFNRLFSGLTILNFRSTNILFPRVKSASSAAPQAARAAGGARAGPHSLPRPQVAVAGAHLLDGRQAAEHARVPHAP